MPFPELHEELWSKIFSLLVRDPPPAHLFSPWSQLHQEDLARISRVNSTFQALAAPYLYTSVIIADLPLFLHGLESPSYAAPTPPLTPPGTIHSTDHEDRPMKNIPRLLSKADLLKHTQHFRIAYDGPNCQPRVSASKLLATGREEWDILGENHDHHLIRMKKESNQHLRQLLRIEFDRLCPNGGIMPNLDTVVLGKVTSSKCCWAYFGEDALDPEVYARLNLFRYMFTRMIFACRPQFICTHASYGPFQFKGSQAPRLSDETKVPQITTHLHDYYAPPDIFLGADNRIIVEPTIDYIRAAVLPDTHTVPNILYELNEQLLKIDSQMLVGQKKLDRLDDTSIAFYGLCRPAAFATKGIENLIPDWLEVEKLSPEQIDDDDFMELFEETKSLQEGERELMCILEAETLPKFNKKWRGKILLGTRWESECDACEWDAYEE